MSSNNKTLRKRLKQIIKEELEVVLTNEEVGDFFGEDIQAKLEEGVPGGGPMANPAETEEAEAAQASAERGSGSVNVEPMEEDLDESNAADAADELTGRVPDAGAQMLEQSIEDLLDPESEFYEGLSGEELERAMPSPIVRNVLETLYNFIMGGRMEEAADSDEEKERLPRVAPKDIDRLRRTHTGDYKRHQAARKKMSK
jgi:uncharacterized protein with von Willebrand factor type A (vWA) domain